MQRALSCVVVLVTLVCSACKSDDPKPSIEDAGQDPVDAGAISEQKDASVGAADAGHDSATPADAKDAGSDGGNAADAAADAQTDAGDEIVGFHSNTENAVVVQETDPVTKVRLVSSNLRQSPSADQYFQQWYAELVNDGTDIVCLLNLVISFQNASGTELASFDAYIDSPAYEVSASTLSTDCIGPGEHAAMYSNAFVDAVVDLDAVKKLDLTWDGIISAGVAHPLSPTLVSSNIVSDTWVAGDYRNDATPIYNIVSNVYPRDDDGFIFDRLGAFHLETFYDDDVWSYETDAADVAFDNYLQFVSFIEGVEPP